jgi:hypothetical protein
MADAERRSSRFATSYHGVNGDWSRASVWPTLRRRRKVMKRTAQRTRLVLVSALAVVALALAGCATDNDDNGGDTGSTTTVPLLTTTTVP